MGFLDTVVVPGATASTGTSPKPATGKGTFLSSVQLPTDQQKANRQAALSKSASDAQAAAAEANSVGGIFRQAISDIWGATKDYVTKSAQQAVDYAKNNPPAVFGFGTGGTPPLIGVNLAGPSLINGFAEEVPQHVADAFKTSFTQGTDAVTAMLEDYKNGTGSTAGDVANLAHLTSAVAGMLFSPVSGTFEAAQDFPVLKQVADAVNVPFTLTGLAGAYATGKVVDILPISQQSKDTLRAPLSDLGSLAAQVFVGGKIMAKAGDVIKSGREITPPEAAKIVSEVKAEHPEVFSNVAPEPRLTGFLENLKPPEPAPSTRVSTKAHEQYMQEMGYEPYTPPEKLPIIDYGKPAKTELPVIQTEIPARKVPGDITYEPIKEAAPTGADLAYQKTKENGGVTINLAGDMPKNGYAYAPSKTTERAIPTKEFDRNYEQHINSFVEDNWKELQKPGSHIGIRESDGKTFLDVSRIGPPTIDTIAQAQNASQLAVFDLKKGREIPIGAIDNGVYTKLDEASRIHDQYVGKKRVAGKKGGGSGGEKVSGSSGEGSGPAAEVAPRAPAGSGESRQSTLAAKVAANAVEKKIVDTFGKLPEYKRVDMKEQAQFASDIVNADPQKALQMALGNEPVPAHMLPEAIFTAVEERALLEKDVATLRALATESKLSLEATAMGQRIRALGEREQNSPVRIMQDIRDARARAVEKRQGDGAVKKAKKEIAQQIDAEMKKAASKRPTWEEFIKEVQCQY